MSTTPEPRPTDLRSRRPDAKTAALELARLVPRLRAVALRIVRDPHAAEDVAQNALEKALRGLEQFDGRSQLSTWAHRIVVNESLMWLRREGRRRRHEVADGGHDESLWERCADPRPDAEQRLVGRQRIAALRRGLSRLPGPEREVLVECALGGRPYRELAARREVAVPTLKTRAFRARGHLRSLLEASA